MPSRITVCFSQFLHLPNGRKIEIGRECFTIPLLIDPDLVPGIPPIPDPRDLHLLDIVRRFDGAEVGPTLRDLSRTLHAFHVVDDIEIAEVRVPLQKAITEHARILARVALPDGEVEVDLDLEDRFVSGGKR
jgi:hypothetical protein